MELVNLPFTVDFPRLAERSRPTTLAGYIGQSDIVGPGSLLRARIEAGEGVGSCILWGPPGCGKTYVCLSNDSPDTSASQPVTHCIFLAFLPAQRFSRFLDAS